MLQGVAHQPFGHDDLYSTEPTERFPRDPMSGDTVNINASTWPVEMGQTVWITWTKNGVSQPAVGAQWQSSHNNVSYWSATLGQFARGDAIQYSVHANENGAHEQVVGPFSFGVTSWSGVTTVVNHTDHGTAVDIKLDDTAGSFHPVLRLAFATPEVLHLQFSPTGNGLTIADQKIYTLHEDADTLRIATGGMLVVINKKPYRMAIYRADGYTLVVQEYDSGAFRNFGWASDGASTITRIENHFQTSDSETFSGFGERYEALNLYGRDINTFIYNQYVTQAATGRSYLSVPFFLNSSGYGLWLNTSATSTFNIGTYRRDMAGFTVTATGPNPTLEYYLFVGGPGTILDRYTSISSRPLLPPKWVFGIWVSANEWNSQAQVTDVLDAAAQNQVPITALVLEQWSDEATFYVWWGAQYTPKSGDLAFTYADFTFPADSLWQDPKQMVADAHTRGIHVVLWQQWGLRRRFTGPKEHYPTTAPPQLENDIAYARKQGYLATGADGTPYTIPSGWFGGSYVLDFTNPAATAWWMSKRAYLLDEVKIDGFKCDGGEQLFGRFTKLSDGRLGDVMHNAYPSAYIGAYNDFVRKKLGDEGVVFARAGSYAPQSIGIYWAGDQVSTFEGFTEAIRAGLSAGQTGVPFWGWDMAGFSGPSPSAELYLRAAAMATFCPIFQLHSQWSAPGTTQTRLPWQIQAVTGDPEVVPAFRYFANVRMNLLPYIYSEAKKAATTGIPLMRTMATQFPGDPGAGLETQYMFGDCLMVVPITTQGATGTNVYVPIGEWYDFWYSAQLSGPRTKWYDAGLNSIPVYARPGAIVPLNLNADYQLGGAIDNSVGPYANLTFRIYPSGRSTYDYFDDAANTVSTLQVDEVWSLQQVSIVVPGLSVAPSLQIIGTAPASVSIDGAAVPMQPNVAALKSASSGWFWDPVLQAALVKLPSSNSSRNVLLSGVGKSAYEAEFADAAGTAVHTNHANYTGVGFVDQFDAVGKAVMFRVNADISATYTLAVRYANAMGTPATRTVYVDGQRLGTLTMPALADWDTWATASVSTFLTAGPHQVDLRFESESTTPINVDSLSVAWQAPATVSVVTRHSDNNHSGANLQETRLTPATVTPDAFGHLFSYPVRGQIFAQPLYLSGLEFPGRGIRNVLFVATMHNQVYAFDADNPYQGHFPFWQRSLEPAIKLPDPNIGTTYIDAQRTDTGSAYTPAGKAVYRDIVREVGILSTPVISPEHNAIYVVTASKDPAKNDPSAYTHHLHALELTTGNELFGGPVVIEASAPGEGFVGRFKEQDNVVDGKIVFTSHRQLQRPALTLANDTIYIAFASYGDKDCYHGWVLAYAATSLQQTAAFVATPSKLASKSPRDVGRAGIWQAGEGLAADAQGIYMLTGNGGYKDGTDFADCFLKLDPVTLKALDWFTPFNTLQLAERDLDVGSSGALLVPGSNLLIGGGKESKLFVLKRDQMGHFDASAGNGQIVQHFYVEPPDDPTDPIGSAAQDDGTGHHIHGSPVTWQGPNGTTIYVWCEDAVVKAFQARGDGTYPATPLTLTGIPNAQLGTPASMGNSNGLGGAPGKSPGMPGGSLTVSANGGSACSAILWATHPLANANTGIAAGLVRAYDASDLSRELWNSQVNPSRDSLPSYAKFCPPTVANGRVYVPTFSDRVMVYGLF